MRMLHRSELVVCLLLAADFAACSGVRASAATPFRESLQSDVSVSGHVVVGVAATSASTGSALLAGITVPRMGDEVCVLVQSRDGNYQARNAFKVLAEHQSSPGRWVSLDMRQTRQSRLLKSYAEGDVALSIKPGDCDQSGSTWLIANGGEGVGDSVDILINSINATSVFVILGEQDEIECTEFLEGRRTSFDFRCRLPRSLLNEKETAIQIGRERYGRPLPPVSMTLIGGAG